MVLNVIGFIVLSILVKRIAVTGFGSLAYFAWYCTVRGVMEIFRSETNAFDKKMGFNTVMVFSFVMAVLFIAGLVTVLVVKKKRGGRIWYKNGIPPLPPEEKKEEATLTLK